MNVPTDFLDSLDATRAQEKPEVEAAGKQEPAVEKEFDDEESEDEDEQEEQAGQPEKTAKVEEKAATTAASEPKDADGFKAGMLAERKKRKELEDKLRVIEAEKQKQPEQPAPKPVQFREDPEKFVSQAVAEVRAAHLNSLEDDMREQHEDFDEMAALVVAAAELDPALRAKVFQAGNPARAMYKLGKQLQEAEKLRDPEVYKASIRDEVVAEVSAKLRKELGLPEDGAKPAKTPLPRDLSNGRSGTDTVATTPPVDPRRGSFDNLFDNRRPPS